ncbi:hypothetical protein Htur_0184 [Haloterrigena turkmenica DSM 5511]|uniref:Uncharacterized protein n=1 Tax=Haloterrigena turkmenica (strain ATCC 51198 / DSM 5511 / JCM 9101 / NCIMB 13204 / VKM B-1734 / 4k) TaxID=543526 RepID=D2RU16_HALTV|nr:hypothetical protein [Haloterrigena turkmenica]ADB59085.1 hypothetical protein Htur_0184 [Haloterrigena turkmenica DSM 5511]
MSTHVDEIDWARIVERLLYLFPPIVGVGIVGVLQDTEPGVPGLQFVLLLLSGFGYTALTLGLLVAIFFDARRIRRRPRAGGNWTPNPWLNAAAALVSAPIAGVAYLVRRHRRFGTPAGRSDWWLVVAVSLATTLFGFVAAAVAIVFTIPGLLAAAVGLAGTVAIGSFPVAIHRDAAYVCTRTRSWRPNPALYLGIAFLSLFVPPLQPIVAGYYLVRRHDAVGRP